MQNIFFVCGYRSFRVQPKFINQLCEKIDTHAVASLMHQGGCRYREAGGPGTEALGSETEAGGPGTEAGGPGTESGRPGTEAVEPGIEAGGPKYRGWGNRWIFSFGDQVWQ